VPSDLSPKVLVPPGFLFLLALALMVGCNPYHCSYKEFGSQQVGPQDSSDRRPPVKTSDRAGV
jgi:hypothetical protein